MIWWTVLYLIILSSKLSSSVRAFDQSDSSPQTSFSSYYSNVLMSPNESEGSKLWRASEDEKSQKNNEIDKSKKKKRKFWKKPIGLQSKETKMNKKIVQFLAKENNGIRNYKSAKEASEKYFENKRNERNKKDREKYKINQKKDIFKIKNPGHQGKNQTIERKIKFLMKKDQTLTEPKARKIAKKDYRALRDQKNEYQRKYRAIKKGKF